jgi:transcriptional antiterminator/mannitol/fructose-specific phosphotransferase system IIA component (Ntr-type)
MQDISYFLSEHGLTRLVKITNRGIAFTGTDGEGEFLASHLIDRDFYLYKLSSEERVCIITLKLLLSGGACTLSDLEKQFNASRVTIIKDIEQVRLMVTRYNMAFETSTSHGYRLAAEEKDRRELISKVVFHPADSFLFPSRKVNLYAFFIDETYFHDLVQEDFSDILRKAEDYFGISVSDARFEEVLFSLILMTARISKGFALAPDAYETEAAKKLSVYDIARFIGESVRLAFGAPFPDSELAYLARKLYECNFYNAKFIEDNSCMQTHIVLISFLDRIGRELGIPLSDDSQLIVQLSNHLKDMNKAFHNGVVLQNEFREKIIDEYCSYYQLIGRNCGILEDHFGYRFSDDEIAYIILYIAVSIERYFEEETVPKVIVVCHSGIGTANFLVERLKANFNLRVLASTSSHKLADTVRQYDYDLIVSTVILPGTAGNWIKVSPMLEDNDIVALQRALLNIKREKKKRILSKMQYGEKTDMVTANNIKRLEQVLPEDNILLDVNCSDWSEGIRLAAAPLLVSESITEQYVQAIEESVIANGAYFVFCPGVALAHAGPGDGVKRFEISLARLHTPVCFGHKANDPVRYIICFGSTNSAEDANLILKLMNIISAEGMLEQLDTFHDSALFYRHIIRGDKREEDHE